jgi:hypothetical protein
MGAQNSVTSCSLLTNYNANDFFGRRNIVVYTSQV